MKPRLEVDLISRISSVEIRGRCFCNGHASSCELSEPGTQPRRPVCQCEHNTMGANCESCRPGFNQNPWAPANYRYDEVNQCEEPKNLGSRSGDIRAGVVDSCQCNGHSDRCGAIGQESWCVGCRDNTDGKTCSQCIPGFYSDPKLPTKGKFKEVLL